MAQESRDRRPSLFPQEQGAYMELGFPIMSAFMLGSPTRTAVLLGLTAGFALLAHQPLMNIAAARVGQVSDKDVARSAGSLLVLAILVACSGSAALWGASDVARWLAVVPVALGAVTLGLAALGRGRTLTGELTAALALSSVALPVGVAAGLSVPESGTVAFVWALGFCLTTAAGHGVIVGKGLGMAGLLAAIVSMASIGLAISETVSPWLALAPLPLSLAALGLALRPPYEDLTRMAFAFTGASAFCLGLLATAPLL